MANDKQAKLAIDKCSRCGTKYQIAEDKTSHDVSRNITKEERLAMFKWGHEYAQSGQSARCFWRSLDMSRRKLIKDVLAGILEAA
jgi:hypothetical protein